MYMYMYNVHVHVHELVAIQKYSAMHIIQDMVLAKPKKEAGRNHGNWGGGGGV